MYLLLCISIGLTSQPSEFHHTSTLTIFLFSKLHLQYLFQQNFRLFSFFSLLLSAKKHWVFFLSLSLFCIKKTKKSCYCLQRSSVFFSISLSLSCIKKTNKKRRLTGQLERGVPAEDGAMSVGGAAPVDSYVRLAVLVVDDPQEE